MAWEICEPKLSFDGIGTRGGYLTGVVDSDHGVERESGSGYKFR